MLVLHQLSYVFVYTLWHLYAFFGTNILTSATEPVFCFLLILCFRKTSKEIFSELDETKANLPIFQRWRRSPEERGRRTPGRPHLVQARPGAGHPRVWLPQASTNLA